MPRRCQDGSTHMSTGHGSSAGRASARTTPGRHPAADRTDTSSSPGTCVGSRLPRPAGADGDLPAEDVADELGERGAADPLGRGERRLPADLDDGGPDGHLEHVLGPVGGLDVGVEEVGDDVGEGRRMVEDLLGRPDVARRLVVERVLVDAWVTTESPPARRTRATTSASPQSSGARNTSSTVAVPGSRLLNTWTAPMLAPALPHSWARGASLPGRSGRFARTLHNMSPACRTRGTLASCRAGSISCIRRARTSRPP